MYRKFAIGFFAAFVLVGGIYVTDITHAEHSHTLHPMYNGIGFGALALFLAALMSYVLHVILDSRPARSGTPQPAEAVAGTSAARVEDHDNAPTIRITPHTVRAHVPAQRPRPKAAVFAGSDPADTPRPTVQMVPVEMAPVTADMRPPGYVEMIPVAYAQMMERAMFRRGLADGRQRAVEVATGSSPSPSGAQRVKDQRYWDTYADIMESVLGLNDADEPNGETP